MKEVIATETLPIKVWAEIIEDGAKEQAKHLANLPFAFHHVALMPDAHWGYGMPIGGVLATEMVIIPNAVGVDIGCGMCAVRTSLTELDTDSLKKILAGIREAVPLGFDWHETAQDEKLLPPRPDEAKSPVVRGQYNKALKQIGTLGGGNHFIEIQRGSDGFVWLMVHSGSRNLGKQVAEHYNEIAKKLNRRWRSAVPPAWDLAFLPIETSEAKCYLAEMQYCVDFALANRKLMVERIQDAFRAVTPGIAFDSFINIAHNYAAIENHFDANVIVHRKGATQAREGQLGIIPGSQGTKSYIVRGKGNPESFQSCSHGAGRVMGRKQAIRELDLKTEQEALDRQGILHSIRHQEDLEEAPSAYKNIDTVMANQRDLVDIEVELSPLAVIKG